MNLDFISNLSRRMWITKKARMNAAERLDKYDKFYQFLITYYSVFIVGLSIANLKNDTPGDSISLMLLVASISLTVFSLFVNSRNFRERHLNMKSNYNYISKLLDELDFIIDIHKNGTQVIDKKEIDNIMKKYNELLSYVENHTLYDSLEVILNDNSKCSSLSRVQIIQIYCYKLISILKSILLMILPFIILIVFKYNFVQY